MRPILTALACSVPALLPAAGTVAQPVDQPECQALAIAVTPAPLGPQTLFGQLCAAGALRDGQPVQVLLHGGAYDHLYWDWPNRPEQHSFVVAATGRGYATLNIDRLGYGRSSRPDGAGLSFEIGAEAIGQVIDQLQAAQFGFQPGPIILNGHSMGGIVAEHVAGRRDDIAALIVSGLTDGAAAAEDQDEDADGGPPEGAAPFIPARDDPRFAAAPWAEGYLTTAPGARIGLFHGAGQIAADNARLEEALKDSIAKAEIAAVQGGGSQRPGFDGPSLYVLGQFDVIACQGQDCAERFAGDPGHRIITGAGHSLNTSAEARAFFDLSLDWLAEQGMQP